MSVFAFDKKNGFYGKKLIIRHTEWVGTYFVMWACLILLAFLKSCSHGRIATVDFFITTNISCGIQCTGSHGAIVTIKLNDI